MYTLQESQWKHSLVSTMITPKFASISNCLVPKCTSFELVHTKKHNPQAVKQQAIKEKEGIFA